MTDTIEARPPSRRGILFGAAVTADNPKMPDHNTAHRQVPQSHAAVLSLNDVRVRSRRGKTFIFDELKTGRLRHFKIGRRTLVTERDFEAWLRSYGANL